MIGNDKNNRPPHLNTITHRNAQFSSVQSSYPADNRNEQFNNQPRKSFNAPPPSPSWLSNPVQHSPTTQYSNDLNFKQRRSDATPMYSAIQSGGNDYNQRRFSYANTIPTITEDYSRPSSLNISPNKKSWFNSTIVMYLVSFFAFVSLFLIIYYSSSSSPNIYKDQFEELKRKLNEKESAFQELHRTKQQLESDTRKLAIEKNLADKTIVTLEKSAAAAKFKNDELMKRTLENIKKNKVKPVPNPFKNVESKPSFVDEDGGEATDETVDAAHVAIAEEDPVFDRELTKEEEQERKYKHKTSSSWKMDLKDVTKPEFIEQLPSSDVWCEGTSRENRFILFNLEYVNLETSVLIHSLRSGLSSRQTHLFSEMSLLNVMVLLNSLQLQEWTCMLGIIQNCHQQTI